MFFTDLLNIFVHNSEIMQPYIHEGLNVKRIREMFGIKQEALAITLGVNQQKMSFIESKAKIEDEMLVAIAKALNVTVEAIKNFSEEVAITIISSTLHDQAGSVNYSPTFNPIDKIVELYERLVETEKGKVQMLEKLLNERK